MSLNHKKLKKLSINVKKTIIDISYQANKGHISSALSIVEILTVLYWNILNINKLNLKSTSRNRFILSKGHAANALYAVLFEKEIISQRELNSYGKNGTYLGVHPDTNINGIEFSTGSLGHGLGVGAGIALGSPKIKVYVLISDAECQEGSVWESALFASHHKLNNLFCIIDYNKTQAFGSTNSVTNLEPLKEKWKSFGWKSYSINGNDIKELNKYFKLNNKSSKPCVFICNTTSGKDISFMENQIKWHYLNLSNEEYNQAKEELKKL